MYRTPRFVLRLFRAPARRQLPLFTLFLSLALSSVVAYAQGTISTVAGSDFCCDGGRVTDARLGQLFGVTVDSAANIYAFDAENHRVVKISAAGVLTVVAGSGKSGFSADGGPATKSAFGELRVSSLAVDAAGNLFIPDLANNRIRKVAPGGIITTVAGDGAAEFSGDGGPATRASLNKPNGVAVDGAGNLFIADGGNYRVRKVTPGEVISTVPGVTASSTSSSGLLYPSGIAVDSAGNLLVTVGSFLRKATPEGVVSTLAGTGNLGSSGDGGPATAAAIYAWAVAVDAAGNLFIAEDARVRKVGRDGIISTIAGDGTAGFSGDGGPATAARFDSIRSVAVDAAGNLLIADSGNRRIRRITPAGIVSTIAGNGIGDGGPATGASLRLSLPGTYPQVFPAVAVDSAGNIFFAELVDPRVRKVDSGGLTSTVAGNGLRGSSGDGGPAIQASLTPAALAVDSAGNLFIAVDGGVRKVGRDGTISTVVDRLKRPRGLAVDAADNLFIADIGGIYGEDAGVLKVTPAGGKSRVSSSTAWGVAVDQEGNVFVAAGSRVRKVTPDGTTTVIAGMGGAPLLCSGDGGPATAATLWAYGGIAVHAAGGVFVADSFQNRVRRISPDGTIWTVAGNGTPIFSGDGGPATRAGLSVAGVAVDKAGSLYIADYVNNRIRKVVNPIDSADVPCIGLTPQFSGIQTAANSSGGIAAGSLASLYGAFLTGTEFFNWVKPSQLPLPTTVSDVTIRLNGIPVPLLYVSDLQINFQVPWELMRQDPVYIELTAKGMTGIGGPPAPAFMLKRPAAPGLFSQFGKGLVLIANTGISAQPPAPFFNSRPANRGEYVSIFCTGLGNVTNRPASGAPALADPLSVTLDTPTVTIGGKTAAVSFSGLAPSYVGLYQINVQVPADAPVGDAVPLVVTQSGVPSNTVTIAVQ